MTPAAYAHLGLPLPRLPEVRFSEERMAKLLIALSIVLVLCGLWWSFGGTFRPGNLPGDFGFYARECTFIFL